MKWRLLRSAFAFLGMVLALLLFLEQPPALLAQATPEGTVVQTPTTAAPGGDAQSTLATAARGALAAAIVGLPAVLFTLSGLTVGFILNWWQTEHRRVRLDAVGLRVVAVGGAWLFFYDFRPVRWRIVPLRRPVAAATKDAGGAVRLVAGRPIPHVHFDCYWEGPPWAGVAALYSRKGLLAFGIFPRGHLVSFFVAGTATAVGYQALPPGAYGMQSFEWDECKDWPLELSAGAPEAHVRTVPTTVAKLCRWAWETEQCPRLPPLVTSMDQITDRMLIKGAGAKIYLVRETNGALQKRHVPDASYFKGYGWSWEDVTRVDDELLARLPDGPPVERQRVQAL